MLQGLVDLFDKFAGALMEVLPTSPFQKYIQYFSELPYLGYLNWFVPIDGILVVLASWLGCIGLFYLYSIVMRWLKILGD